ncbi:FMN-dependent dehydrogenase-domain-containing protein [Russula earlei]|uniref:FMN-dependent dehydrogenase-domain-containing protein n=1 Tax=Russula earlei TaxID=71964 RepID=A0ACC0UL06_9AGAM|nr:FMN-dependent dehydrogenase-domain-containing protein [Russula earlei]
MITPGGASDELKSYVTYAELQHHTSRSSLWVLISGIVYDVTSLLSSHPGGIGPLFKYAGKDATRAFVSIHPRDALDTLPHSAYIGPIDPITVPQIFSEPTAEENRIAKARAALPHPRSVLSLSEIERLAKGVLSKKAWAYYRSAGDDEITFSENRESFTRFWFCPRVLNKVSNVTTASTILGMPSSLPIFIAPAALARLGHPDGEMNLVRAAGRSGILQGISNNASCSVIEIMSVKRPKQHLIFQLYMNKDRTKTEKVVRGLQNDGFSAIMLTVDAAVPGKRELDQRTQGEWEGPAANGKVESESKGVAHSIGGYQDPDVCWNDIPWIRNLTKLPLVIKGIQCLEDAERALEVYKVDGIVLSNHGGRELDYSPAPMTVLYEMRQVRPDLLDRHQVLIDGGVTRGTDVLKALCLGARAVGLGRAFLYANSIWGEEGCMRGIEIMREEIELGMRLLGVTRLEELRPERVRFVDHARLGLRSRL